jgi:hypothetical protein
MPYGSVEEYANIYNTQDEVYRAQHQALDDVLSAASLVVTVPKGEKVPATAIDRITDRIGMAQMRLYFLGKLVDSLDEAYQKYRVRHPEAFPAPAPSAHAVQTPSHN